MKKLIGALAVGMIAGAAAAQVVGMAWADPPLGFRAEITVKKDLGQAVAVTSVGSNTFEVPIAYPGAYRIQVLCSVIDPTLHGNGTPRGDPLPGPAGPRGNSFGSPLPGSGQH